MTDRTDRASEVFVSYAREDRAVAEALATALEAAGYRVWWDFSLIGGQDYRSEIRAAIRRADRVVVLWSADSVGSHFVIDEASLAKSENKLVPVRIAEVEPPLGFGALHTVDCLDPASDSTPVIAALSSRPAPRARLHGPSRRRLITGLGAGLGAVALGLGGYGGWQVYRAALKTKAPLPRLALVVGNGAYANVPVLTNPANDARAVAERLAGTGFKVGLLLDSKQIEFRDAINQFKTLLSLGGIGVFYYAGHAIRIDDRDFILPVDLPRNISSETITDHAIEITEIRAPITSFFSSLQSLRLRHAGLTILDPPADESEGAAPAEDQPGWDTDTLRDDRPRPAPPAGTGLRTRDLGVLTVYSAARGNVAYDGSGAHSPFAEAFLHELGSGTADASRVARGIRIRVTQATNAAQTPEVEDRTLTDFHFNAPDQDPRDGILRLVFLDSSRSNPFAVSPPSLNR